MKKAFGLILLVVMMASCQAKRSELSEYKGMQVVEKDICGFGYYFEFRGRGRVYVYQYDWNLYNLGDTIK